jgi:predicted adenine nucleotide alpha hydrolase (AANH) superfamily ATPase
MKIVLHICCGVCAAGAASVLLTEGHTVTGYFYNPNLYPESEYCRRLAAARATAEHLGFSVVEGPYDPSVWLATAEAFQHEPEWGQRCALCYRLRLENSFRFMTETAQDAFTSTLTISPHKSAKIINAIGEEIGGERFLARDFKKKDGFKKAVGLAKGWGLYRQNYCGCLYSMRENHG